MGNDGGTEDNLEVIHDTAELYLDHQQMVYKFIAEYDARYHEITNGPFGQKEKAAYLNEACIHLKENLDHILKGAVIRVKGAMDNQYCLYGKPSRVDYDGFADVENVIYGPLNTFNRNYKTPILEVRTTENEHYFMLLKSETHNHGPDWAFRRLPASEVILPEAQGQQGRKLGGKVLHYMV